MSSTELRRTPLYANHVALGARMVPFAGYEMPVQYSGVLEETKACRAAAGLFDVSHMGQFSVRGKNSLAAVQSLVTNDLKKLQLGQAQYNMLCNPNGGVIDDLIVYRRSDDEIYICVNASNRAEDFEWMKKHLNGGLSFIDESEETALIAIQGPNSVAIMERVSDAAVVKALPYYWAKDTKVFQFPCYLSRTGYTGEDGFELYLKKDHASAVWDRLLEEGKKDGLVPCGLGSRDTLRLEMGYPLHGHELGPTISPLAANLGWVVKLKAGNEFVGKAALEKEAAEGSKKTLRAFTVNDRRIARAGYTICLENKTVVGEITSGTQSPHLNAPICLGFVETKFKDEKKVFVDVRGTLVPMTTTGLPFVKPSVRKN